MNDALDVALLVARAIEANGVVTGAERENVVSLREDPQIAIHSQDER